MNTKELNGKEISEVIWPIGGPNPLIKTEDNKIIISATFHGDSDEFWIIEYKRVGKDYEEVARHNMKYIQSYYI